MAVMPDSEMANHLREYIDAHGSTCPKCDYELKGLSDPRCPECGAEITVDAIVDADQKWSVIYNANLVGFLFSGATVMVAHYAFGIMYLVGFVLWIIYGKQMTRLSNTTQVALTIVIWFPFAIPVVGLFILIVFGDRLFS